MIDSTAIIERLNRTKKLSVKLTSLLLEGIRVNKFEIQETLLSPGNYANAFYYIQTGLVRGAIEGKKNKLTTWIKKEGDLIIPHNVFKQQPSEEYIITVAQTNVLAIPVKHIEKIIESNPEMMELFILLMDECNSESHYREKLLRIPEAKDRYNYMAKNESFILRRIPHHMIATYLNVTKETFSRLNRGLAY